MVAPRLPWYHADNMLIRRGPTTNQQKRPIYFPSPDFAGYRKNQQNAMSKTKSNIPKSKRGGYDFWGRRPGSGHSPLGGLAKRIIRRIERRMRSVFIEQSIRDQCFDCGRSIFNNDDAKVCIDCGGVNKLAE